MRSIFNLSLVFLCLPLIYSCSKESLAPPDDNDDKTIVPEEVFAGMYDTTFNYVELDPIFTPTINWDDDKLYGSGYDSLDINRDGLHDLFIRMRLINYDSIHLMTGGPRYFPMCTFELKNGFEIAMYGEGVLLVHGGSQTTYFVDVLDLEERIDTLSNWYDENALQIKFWAENDGGVGRPPYGEWYEVNSVKYIGIRKDQNKHGWIKIDNTDIIIPKILSIAMRKY
jgi:hypothetical protein